MKSINALRLTKVEKRILSNNEMNQVQGGHCGGGNNGCGCGCSYEGTPGGSTSFDNHTENRKSGWSPTAISVAEIAS